MFRYDCDKLESTIMTLKSKSIPFLAVVIAALGTACGVSSQTETASVETSATVDVVTAKEKRHQEASQYIKPGASVTMTHNFTGFVKPGSNGSVQVKFTSKQQGGTMSVQLSEQGGLAISSKALQQSFAMKSAGNQSLDIPFSTQAPGLKYINIIVNTTDASGQSSGRAFTIPIQVGDPAFNKPLQPNPNLQTTPEGEKLIIMDAEE